MDFELTQDQKMISESAAAFARRESPVTRLRALRADPLGYTKATWKKMGELGWLGILLPAAVGGFGGSFVDAGLILEALGSTLVPEPFLASVVLAGSAIRLAGSDAQRERYLGPLVTGDTTLAFAYAESAGRYDPAHVTVRASKDGRGYRLSGKKSFVLNGHAADVIVVSARTSGGDAESRGVSLFLVDPKERGVRVQPIQTMDGHHAAMVAFEDVALGPEHRLGDEDGALATVERVLDYGSAAACAEGVGVLKRSLDMTIEYLGTREQFGVKIGSFQALQHRAVDMFVELETARSTSILASIRIDDDDDIERKAAISTAKVQLAVSGRFVTQQAIQLHGGIGVTDEHDIGLYFKRMHVLNALFGDEEYHVARYGSLPSFHGGRGAVA